MKTITYLLLLTLPAFSFGQANESEAPYDTVEEITKQTDNTTTEIYTSVDIMAAYPGGVTEMKKYLAENLHYPENARRFELQGKCFVRFIINKKGKISDVKIIKGVPDCPECDAEAICVVQHMPCWKPAKLHGKKVPSYFNLPVTFKLE